MKRQLDPYSYDRADRIQPVGAANYLVNAAGDTLSPRLKPAGLRRSAPPGVLPGQQQHLHHCHGNRHYTYNGDGLRWTTTTNATTRYWVTGIDTMVLNDGGYKYVYGLGLAYAVDSLGNTLTQHTDGLGSVRAETDSSGNVVQTYGTDEFGIVDAALTSGTQPTPSSTPASRGTLRPGWSICEPGATTQRSDGSCRVIRCARAGQALAGGIGTSTWGIVR